MLFSGGACSRRVSLFLKPFSFPRRCAKLERERERVGSWERAGEFCLRCFVLCGMPREGGKRQKRTNFFFSFFFSETRIQNTTGLIYKGKGERTEYYCVRTPFIYYLPFAFNGVAKCERRKLILILKVARQTKKQEVVKKHNKKKEEKRQKASALHEVFM